MSAPVLQLEGLSRSFGGLKAVDDVSLHVPAGARHAIIGPNGAGKSTLFKLVTGDLAPTGGSVHVGGRDVTAEPMHARARLGVAQTFQHSSLFGSLSCRDNVVLAAQRAAPGRWAWRRHAAPLRARCDDLLAECGLAGRADASCAALSHGERRQLEVAVALAAAPRLLLLDEPAAGMSPAETERLAATIEGLSPELTIVVVEHDLDLVFRVARTVTVLHLGRTLADGPVEAIRESPEVEEVYLGGAAADDIFLEPA